MLNCTLTRPHKLSHTEGLLRITGRTRELFKTGKGKYVAPAPIENLLNPGPGIEVSCVSGLGISSEMRNQAEDGAALGHIPVVGV
jgi:hypothetical protein